MSIPVVYQTALLVRKIIPEIFFHRMNLLLDNSNMISSSVLNALCFLLQQDLNFRQGFKKYMKLGQSLFMTPFNLSLYLLSDSHGLTLIYLERANQDVFKSIVHIDCDGLREPYCRFLILQLSSKSDGYRRVILDTITDIYRSFSNSREYLLCRLIDRLLQEEAHDLSDTLVSLSIDGEIFIKVFKSYELSMMKQDQRNRLLHVMLEPILESKDLYCIGLFMRYCELEIVLKQHINIRIRSLLSYYWACYYPHDMRILYLHRKQSQKHKIESVVNTMRPSLANCLMIKSLRLIPTTTKYLPGSDLSLLVSGYVDGELRIDYETSYQAIVSKLAHFSMSIGYVFSISDPMVDDILRKIVLNPPLSIQFEQRDKKIVHQVLLFCLFLKGYWRLPVSTNDSSPQLSMDMASKSSSIYSPLVQAMANSLVEDYIPLFLQKEDVSLLMASGEPRIVRYLLRHMDEIDELFPLQHLDIVSDKHLKMNFDHDVVFREEFKRMKLPQQIIVLKACKLIRDSNNSLCDITYPPLPLCLLSMHPRNKEWHRCMSGALDTGDIVKGLETHFGKIKDMRKKPCFVNEFNCDIYVDEVK